MKHRTVERFLSEQTSEMVSAAEIGPPHVTICVCTYQRPDELDDLITAIEGLETAGMLSMSLVVVENGSSQSGREVVTRHITRNAVPIEYRHEPRQGIAHARNAALAAAKGEYVAFIDDDELPAPGWLVAAYRTCVQYDACGVLGPVLPRFPDGAPSWPARSGLFDRPRYGTGTVLRSDQTRTGNVLMQRFPVENDPEPFDPAFRSSSDQIFFKKLMAEGHTFVWCDEAVVHENVPEERWQMSFLIRRAVFRGVFSRRLVGSSPRPYVHSAVALCGYAVMLPLSMLTGKANSARVLFKGCYHAGRLAGLLGLDPVKSTYVSR